MFLSLFQFLDPCTKCQVNIKIVTCVKNLDSRYVANIICLQANIIHAWKCQGNNWKLLRKPGHPQHHLLGLPKKFTKKSKENYREIRNISQRNPKNFTEKSEKFTNKYKKFTEKSKMEIFQRQSHLHVDNHSCNMFLLCLWWEQLKATPYFPSIHCCRWQKFEIHTNDCMSNICC